MNVEEVLIELGDAPLKKSNYSKVLVAFINAMVARETPFTAQSLGHEVLSYIYRHPDPKVQEKILGKRLGAVRDSDPYRSSVLVFSGIIGFIVVTVALVEISTGGQGMSSDGASVLNTVAEGVLGIVRALVTP